jgi:hypothetical protein
MPTIFNPYFKHEWFYNGPVPTRSEHEIARNYLQGRFKRELSRDPNI